LVQAQAMSLTWQQSSEAIGPHSEVCVRHDCIEHPRLFCLSQKSGADSPWIVLYFVEGIDAQHYHTVGDALQAMRENP
jgi:hypothetical protein